MDIMDTPRTRAEFERNFHLLARQRKGGKLFVQEGLSRSIAGLARVRPLPNGRTDFLSVDESARLQANMINQLQRRVFSGESPDVAAAQDGGHRSPPAPI